MAGNNIYVQGSYVDIHDNEVVNLSVDKAQVRVGDHQVMSQQSDVPEVKMLVESVDEVRDFFWGDSSMAVIFGVCRDCFQYADNMSQFERDFGCVEGLISNTFRHNPPTCDWPLVNGNSRGQSSVCCGWLMPIKTR